MHSLPPHARLLGAGATLTPSRLLYERQQQALIAAGHALPDGLRLGPDAADRAGLAKSAVNAYLAVMCEGQPRNAEQNEEPIVWLAEGVNGPVLFAEERHAVDYCSSHGIEAPTPLLVAGGETAAQLIGETA